MNDFPRILTFYSFKGGVGRSMAVLNAAHALAAKGRHVLVLDMDLEAPGLSGFLRRHDEIGRCARQDMVDLVRWARDCAARELPEPVDPAALPPLSEFVVRVPRDKLAGLAKAWPDLGRVDVIPVDEERDYYGRFAALANSNFDQEALIRVGSVLRDWLKSRMFELEVPEYYGPAVERAARYDYVLVDSRTGVTETGGLCIGPLSDQLVVLTALNDQNVEGTRRFLTEVGILAPLDGEQEAPPEPPAARRLDPKPTLIVASPVPAGEIATKQERLQRLEQAVGQVVAKLSYHPQMALLESVFTRDYQEEYLAKEYAALVDHVLRAAEDDIGFDVMEEIPSLRIRSAPALREPLRKSLRLGAIGAKLLLLLHQMRDDETLTEDEDFVLSDRVCRVLTVLEPHSRSEVLIHWANILVRWSEAFSSADLVASRRDAAMLRYQDVIESPVASTSHKAQALVNRGVTNGKHGDTDGEIADYTAVIQMPDAPAEQKAKALVYRGVTYRQRGDTDSALADYTAVVQMSDAPAEQKAQALVNRGVAHGRRADTDSEIADYTAVVQMPDAPAEQKAKALVYRGWVHYIADRYTEAIQDGQDAVAMDGTFCMARGNLAIALLVTGQTAEALATYDAALQIASPTDVTEMAADLDEAVAKHGSVAGADEVRSRIESRRATLQG